MIFIAQTDTFSDIFWMSIALMFLAAIVGAIFANRRRDRCLKLIDDDHVTLQTTTGRSIWGDLIVFSTGIEVQYDTPYLTSAGLLKNSYMLYGDEMPNMLALGRYIGALTEKERLQRAKQVRKRFDPPFWRRAVRWGRNMFNTVRDAGNKALSAIIGQLAKAKPGTVMSQSTSEMNQIGQTIITGVGNAYEPMLERHIGRPVVLELTSPADPDKKNIELPGYLAEYSDRYVAIFNLDQPVSEALTLEVNENIEGDGLTMTVAELSFTVTNRTAVPLVIESVEMADGEHRELAIVLVQGTSARLARMQGVKCIHLSRVPHIDIVCPRQYARVRHASDHEVETGEKVPAPSLPPAHEDQKVEFP